MDASSIEPGQVIRVANHDMEVACVRFHYHYPEQFNGSVIERQYLPFKQHNPGCLNDLMIDVDITLTRDCLPDLGKLQSLFVTDESWELLAYGDGEFVIRMELPGSNGETLWAATASHDFSRLHVYCGDTHALGYSDAMERFNVAAHYPLDQLVFINALIRNQGVLIHSTGVTSNGKGLLFPGYSGAGKSTFANLIKTNRSLELLSDDRMAVRLLNGQFHMFGTPWPGEAGIARNESSPLHALCFLTKSDVAKFVEITPADALDRLLQVVSIPWYDAELTEQSLAYCETLLHACPIYDFQFTLDGDEVNQCVCEFSQRIT